MVSEIELIVLIKEGDIRAFDEFYKRNWRVLYQTAYRSTSSQEDAKDLVQTVFINLWNCRQNLNPDAYTPSYLFKILKNNIINFYKQDSARRKRLEQLLYLDEVNQYTTEDNLMAKELSIVIDGEIRELPRKMQEVFILSRQQHLSVNEISETLNITPRTVKNQLSNALKILRTKLGMF
ncbi:RNA polymerase sigma-70 factor [Mucilaginibacter sp. HC2]|uniref:RNA polymerase sigma factor n=1 Tax=Mucilaginibacter inviolabilis TaxID=2714892 RepID=UPI00140A112F|nr:RNA polymerase sigma-70 factor [Mucilaginibacter inviolabilis]NHA02310.1 RNA polymerase sigma-70 factor [Mucilaginibacter inviolabilis]